MSDQTKSLVLTRFAEVCGVNEAQARQVLAETLMPKASAAEQLAFIAVCGQYQLNPLQKEIYAFPSKGKVVPIVGVDGWLAIANRHPAHEALETEEIREGGDLVAVKALVWKKGSQRPTTATEYLSECKRTTEPWTKWPTRMLTNNAMIQAIRRAYAVAGIMEPDEAERMGAEERRETKTREVRDTLLERAQAVASEPDPDPQTIDVQAEPDVDPADAALFADVTSGDPEA